MGVTNSLRVSDNVRGRNSVHVANNVRGSASYVRVILKYAETRRARGKGKKEGILTYMFLVSQEQTKRKFIKGKKKIVEIR